MNTEEDTVTGKAKTTVCDVVVEIKNNGTCANICDAAPFRRRSLGSDSTAQEIETRPVSSALKSGRKDFPALPQISLSSSPGIPVSEDRSTPSESDSADLCYTFQCVLDKSDENVHFHSQTPRPKSVSFHTGTSISSEKQVSNANECINYMMQGCELIKVRPSARQYRRFFRLESDSGENVLKWTPSSKKSSKAKILVKSMKEVRIGRTTDVLRSKEIIWNYPEDCAFSIIYNDSFESLDLIAKTPDEANIWVTGLNVLINFAKSAPDSLDDPQKMREKWLTDIFNQADTDQTGFISECEAISLMTGINNTLSSRRLLQKFKEFDHGKQNDERGLIDRSAFVNIFTETTRKELQFILVSFSGKEYMTLEDLQLFLEGEQGMVNVSTEDCLKIIEQYEPSEEARNNKQILIDGLTLYLLSDCCDIFDPLHKTICQDMTHPFPHYFVATSHNTYLLEDQLKGPSSVDGYTTALKMGCRCLKVDCWDGIDGPVVYHGNTLTSKITLLKVLEAILDDAFLTSPYPLIIHLENHCNLENQEKVSALVSEVFKDHLFVPTRDSCQKVSQMSPENLKGKIIIQGKKLSPKCTDSVGEVSDEDEDQECFNNSKVVYLKNIFKKMKLCQSLSDLISLTRMKFCDVELTEEIQKLADVSAFSENMASKLAQLSAEDVINHNKQYLTQVFPNRNRIDSSNYNPLEYWCLGCQLVAMNYQTAGLMMDIYQGWFMQNANCGYTLKPEFLRNSLHLYSGRYTKDPIPGIEPTILNLKIISAQQLPKPRGTSAKASSIDPYIVVQIFGVGADCAEARTRTHEGHSPIFKENFEFTVTVPELALLRIAVLDDEYIGDDFIGQYTIPLTCLRKGYCHVRLLSNNGDPLDNTTVFLYVNISTRSEKQKSKRKKPWLSMKSIGVKQADDLFKMSTTYLSDAFKFRAEEEQAMLDLCNHCGVSEYANIVQCLKVYSTRMAGCHAVTTWDIQSDGPQSSLTHEASGELTPWILRANYLLSKVLVELNYVKNNAHHKLKILNDTYKTGEATWYEMMQNTSHLGLKGRKIEKVVENYMWNMTMLATQTNLLKQLQEQSCTSLNQVYNLMPVFHKLFQRERESPAASVSSNAALTPVLSGQAGLLPSSDPIPLTPTSPGDGRLRGILKKTSTTSVVPILVPQNQVEGATAGDAPVFFPGGAQDGSVR